MTATTQAIELAVAAAEAAGDKLAQDIVAIDVSDHLVITDIQQSASGQITLHWFPHTQALAAAQRQDGRYLLVTNDESLSHREIFRLYRQKDGVETAFHICKSDLNSSLR